MGSTPSIPHTRPQVKHSETPPESKKDDMGETQKPPGKDLETSPEAGYVNLRRALKRVIKQHKQTTNSQIDARQKRRQAGFKRRDVSMRDASFMRELQRLIAQQKLSGFEELSKLAGECQIARDDLGPLEEEGTIAEQQLEGEIWKLEQAEQTMDEKFHNELDDLEALSCTEWSDGSSSIGSGEVPQLSDVGDTDQRQEDRLAGFSLGLEGMTEEHKEWSHVSRDIMLEGTHHKNERPGNTEHPGHYSSRLPQEQMVAPTVLVSGFERYPELASGFSERRARVNRWLLNTALLSRAEADLLFEMWAKENVETPTNWSQLAIAYWENDGLGAPISGVTTRNSTAEPNGSESTRSDIDRRASPKSNSLLHSSSTHPLLYPGSDNWNDHQSGPSVL